MHCFANKLNLNLAVRNIIITAKTANSSSLQQPRRVYMRYFNNTNVVLRKAKATYLNLTTVVLQMNEVLLLLYPVFPQKNAKFLSEFHQNNI